MLGNSVVLADVQADKAHAAAESPTKAGLIAMGGLRRFQGGGCCLHA